MKIKRFSLIELLVVIAIIAILAAILMPAISTVRNNAKKAQARAQMNAIMTAIKTYESTYGVLPVTTANWSDAPSTTATQYTNLMNALTNVPNGSNSRKIRFLDVPNNYATLGYVDPWGNKYQIYIDTSYTGQLSVGSETLYGTVFVSSSGGNVYTWK